MSAVFPLEVRSRCKVVFVLLSCHPLGGFPTGSSLSSLAGEVPLIMSIRVTCRGSFSGYLIVKKEHTRRGRVTCSMFSGRQKVRNTPDRPGSQALPTVHLPPVQTVSVGLRQESGRSCHLPDLPLWIPVRTLLNIKEHSKNISQFL